VQEALTAVPLLQSLSITVVPLDSFIRPAAISIAVLVGWLLPMFKPGSVRLANTMIAATKRVGYAFITLATVGYFDYTYALPRLTLVAFGLCSVLTVPACLGLTRWIERTGKQTTILVADSQGYAQQIANARSDKFTGYVAPSNSHDDIQADGGNVLADGYEGADLDYLGGLSRLSSVVDEHSVNTVFVAFDCPDRGDFFGVLETCHENGIRAMVEHTNRNLVLTEESPDTSSEQTASCDTRFVEAILYPWDVQDRVLKRLFDVMFAVVGLALTLPLILCIAVAIKLDSQGPVLFVQDRTFRFGGTFRFYKFRSMVTDAEQYSVSAEDAGGVDPRVTRVGRVLRRTHLDEIPQLLSILVGDMSVVGPRPGQTGIEHEFEREVPQWPKRWFVKPGLTGLAQIRGATSHELNRKLQYDLEYIRRQSLLFDTKIVVREITGVLSSLAALLVD
jgi:lipopolysaccharide/colanic/teichoic acid biosynthesis glycosyltransferase